MARLRADYDVIVIGGGAVGTAVFRDLSMRKFKTALIEKNFVGHGTTYASHQNLVGGMRYVLVDPITAKQCARENKIISKIAPNIVGKINNYFVGFRDEYTEKALEKAKDLGITFYEKNAEEVKKEIPTLSKDIDIVVETEDKNLDAIAFCKLNFLSAIKNEGELFEETKISKIRQEKSNFILSTNRGEFITKYVVNATGAWIKIIANMVHVRLPIAYSQGTIIVQKTLSSRGIQFFRKPSDADAYIVHSDEAWLGTTATTISDPSEAKPEPWAERYLTQNFSVIIPEIPNQPILRKFTGIRALCKKNNANDRELTRNFNIVEKPEAFFNIIGGKMTTARLMAERISDIVCNKTGVNFPCRTYIEPLSIARALFLESPL
jgi:glycerol-3-phosphate dehydrogenase